jgi:ribulose-5-phosphate 4-epimerase/fuculose-1-phosphate aldolase
MLLFLPNSPMVHSHARDVLPYGLTSGPEGESGLKPCLHTSAFLGDKVPCWDITAAYTTEEAKDRHLLVNNFSLASSLASLAENPTGQSPYHKVVLQRGHGFVALGDSIEESVYNAIYAVENARVQTQAELRSSVHAGVNVQRLNSSEILAASPMDKDCIVKVWPLWVREVEKNPIFR